MKTSEQIDEEINSLQQQICDLEKQKDDLAFKKIIGKAKEVKIPGHILELDVWDIIEENFNAHEYEDYDDVLYDYIDAGVISLLEDRTIILDLKTKEFRVV